jgi:hypothetical protein
VIANVMPATPHTIASRCCAGPVLLYAVAELVSTTMAITASTTPEAMSNQPRIVRPRSSDGFESLRRMAATSLRKRSVRSPDADVSLTGAPPNDCDSGTSTVDILDQPPR